MRVFGEAAVHQHIANQLAASQDVEKWKFFESLDATCEIDLLGEIDNVVKAHREDFVIAVAEADDFPDFSKEVWWN